ncbi:MAG: hypothetical protein IPJ65_42535 [Archangiaceae bacterium]|nr:hypothetical protein [Archangiaceae bacterium]
MRTVLFLTALTSTMAFAQGTEAPAEDAAPKGKEATGAEADAAKELVSKYLVAVKAKKWPDAKKMVHPSTITAIAERKKRLGKEDHPMAPQSYEKTEFYLKDFKMKGVTAGPSGTFIVETAEDNFQVQEKGLVEGEMATYLVGKKDGKWWVVDKKRGETFTNDSVKLGYKGYFDKP